MANKLFLLAIGGTGARVIKSFIHLLSAGATPKDNWTVIPYILDPHIENKDKKEATSLIAKYKSINNKINQLSEDNKNENYIENETGFFTVPIKEIEDLQTKSHIPFNLEKEISDKKFKDFLDHENLSPIDKDFVDLMFSGYTVNKYLEEIPLMDLDMKIGFVGNPNIGVVALNKFLKSVEFNTICSNFNEGDRFFIISSIFGGTGAAGFPLILNAIRDAVSKNFDNSKFLKESIIGALTIMPYFGLEKNDNSPIQYSDFIAKSKIALNYYHDNLNAKINYLCYIAEPEGLVKNFENDPGYNNQDTNKAHFLELVGAMSIIDFLDKKSDDVELKLKNDNKKRFKEFVLFNDIQNNEVINENMFLDDMYNLFFTPFCNYYLTYHFLQNHLNDSTNHDYNWIKETNLLNILNSEFIKNDVLVLMEEFIKWLKEMDQNKRGLQFFNFDEDLSQTLQYFKIENAKSYGLFNPSPKWSNLHTNINIILKDIEKKENTLLNNEEKLFFTLINRAMNKLLDEKF